MSNLIFNLKFCGRRREESDWKPHLFSLYNLPSTKVWIRIPVGPWLHLHPLFQRSLFLLTSLSPFKFPSRIAFFQGSHFEKTTFSQENSILSFFPSQTISLTPNFTRSILLQVRLDLSFNFLIIWHDPLC